MNEKATRRRKPQRPPPKKKEGNKTNLRPGEAEVLEALELGKLHRDDLDQEQAVGVRPVPLVRARGRDHAAAEPHHARLGGRRAHRRQRLGRDAPGRAEHGPAAVDDLAVGEPLRGDEAAAVDRVDQAQGVEAVVPGERLAVQVGQGLVGRDARVDGRLAVDLIFGVLVGFLVGFFGGFFCLFLVGFWLVFCGFWRLLWVYLWGACG